MTQQMPTFGGMQLIDADAITTSVSRSGVVDALQRAITSGFDPEDDVDRVRVDTPTGVLLVMPSTLGGWTGTKLLSSVNDNPKRDLPILQGVFVLFEGDGQVPVAIIDGISLTELRTPGFSALAVRYLAPEPAGPENLVVLGSGVQGQAHVRTLCADRDIASAHLVGVEREQTEQAAAKLSEELDLEVQPVLIEEAAEAVAEADIVCCCTPSSDPLFDGNLVKDTAVVVAMGSHFRDARETDDALVTRAQVVIESRTSVLNEGGDVVIPVASGVLKEEDLTTLYDVVRGEAQLDMNRPRLFKGTGMPWQDLVAAVEIYQSLAGDDAARS